MTNKETTADADIQDQARRLAVQQLRNLQQAGVEFMPKPTGAFQFESLKQAMPTAPVSDRVAEPLASPSTDAAPSTAVAPRSSPPAKTAKPAAKFVESGSYQTDRLDFPAQVEQLKIVSQQVAQCTQCSDLCSSRTNTVFGVGSAQAELCFLGEGPGADEDKQGEPFVGRAGQLLDKIIAACKLSREEVYILNTVKCRPPGNRNPNESELANCWPYAIQQLELIQPKFICCLGSVAARTLLETTQSIGRMRGQLFQYRGSKVVVTYHPAYLLRNPSAKRQVWDDMKMLMAAMGREV